MLIEEKVRESYAQLERTTKAIEKNCTCISRSDFRQHSFEKYTLNMYRCVLFD